MALRDTWHRTLVYFGLAEDDAYEEDLEPYSEPEVEADDTYGSATAIESGSDRTSGG